MECRYIILTLNSHVHVKSQVDIKKADSMSRLFMFQGKLLFSIEYLIIIRAFLDAYSSEFYPILIPK